MDIIISKVKSQSIKKNLQKSNMRFISNSAAKINNFAVKISKDQFDLYHKFNFVWYLNQSKNRQKSNMRFIPNSAAKINNFAVKISKDQFDLYHEF
jgi:hypothetical protein